MKKIEIAQEWVRNHLSLFQCPLCGGKYVSVNNNQLVCENNHSVNFNKHGYLYFLSKKVLTEYNRDFFVSRRHLLMEGLFDPLIEYLSSLLPSEKLNILDVGSGEGTPLYKLLKLRLSDGDVLTGFDIARDGIQMATQLDQRLFFCIADLRHLPYANSSFNYLIELFSPSDYQEFRRVLKPGGKIIKVIPNSEYLKELRQLLYAKNSVHQKYNNQKVKDLFMDNFKNCTVKNVKYCFNIAPQYRKMMVEMSPLQWGQDAKSIEKIPTQKLTRVTVDLQILIGEN